MQTKKNATSRNPYKGIPKGYTIWVRYLRDGETTHIAASNKERTQYFLYSIKDDTATLVKKANTPETFNGIVAAARKRSKKAGKEDGKERDTNM